MRPSWWSRRDALPALMHDPCALPQHHPRRRPARDCRPVGRFRHLEVVHASDMLNDAVAGIVPDVHAEGDYSVIELI